MTMHKPKVACFTCRFTKPIVKLGVKVHGDGTPHKPTSPFCMRRVANHQSPTCPHCNQEMKEIPTTINIPKKMDNQGWEKLKAKSKKYQP